MNSKELRERHDTFTYQDFEAENTGGELSLRYIFKIAPDIEFSSHVTIPVNKEVDPNVIANFGFHLGMIEAVSYWKSTCSPNFIVEAGNLTDRQVSWWHDLYMHGMGEFYYRNDIDFSGPDFLNIESPNQRSVSPKIAVPKTNGKLIMVGGGKDSVVTLKALGEQDDRQNVLLLNPTRAASETSRIAGFREPLIVKREIDKRLLKLNSDGYLNGHTPFSAYLSFLGLFVGTIHDYEHVIASNESSAGEGSLKYHGMDINHQYSKGGRYERLFREYSRRYLTDDVSYFSFLRPLSELQIAALFSSDNKYDDVFCSCNITRNEHFCGNCPKCAFVYLALSPFMEKDRKTNIFGGDEYFDNPKIQQHITDLVGMGEHKPLDCVGTEEESRLAILLTIDRMEHDGDQVPKFLYKVRDQIVRNKEADIPSLIKGLKNDWNKNNFLPEDYEQILRAKLSELEL